jgi:DNA primase
MNIQQAKEIPIIDYLKSLGHNPQKIMGKNHWFLSPLRNEKTPSFKVDTHSNLFYDFGIGYGGTIIDFGIKYHSITVSDFLKKLNDNFSFWQQKIVNNNRSEIVKLDGPTDIGSYEPKILETYKTKDIGNNKAITDYINSRKISDQTAQKFLCEIYYQISGKNYFGVGFKNDSDGYEIRNKYFKGCIGKKDITHFKNGCKTVNIFEGVFDFLSWMQMENSCQDSTDFIVLNSLALLPRTEPLLHEYKNTHFYFDNDDAGINAGIHLKEILPKAVDHRMEYIFHKDLNEFFTESYCKDMAKLDRTLHSKPCFRYTQTVLPLAGSFHFVHKTNTNGQKKTYT